MNPFNHFDSSKIEGLSGQEALTLYRDISRSIAPAQEALKQLRGVIQAQVRDTGSCPEAPGVKVTLREGYTRSSWDNKGLRGYAVTRPEVLRFLKETPVGWGITIKLERGDG